MKLLHDFFKVLEATVNDSGFTTTIELNPNHVVFSGHFPGHPVTPGVVQLQIVHELLEAHLGKKLKLTSVPRCKFLKILNPEIISQIIVRVDFEKKDQLIFVKASGKSDNDVYFKLNSTYLI